MKRLTPEMIEVIEEAEAGCEELALYGEALRRALTNVPDEPPPQFPRYLSYARYGTQIVVRTGLKTAFLIPVGELAADRIHNLTRPELQYPAPFAGSC